MGSVSGDTGGCPALGWRMDRERESRHYAVESNSNPKTSRNASHVTCNKISRLLQSKYDVSFVFSSAVIIS